MHRLELLARDVRQALRRLALEKGFTSTVLLTLALCLGANFIIYTVVHSVLLEPLPFPQPDQLVVVYNSYPKAGVNRAACSWPNYYERQNGAVPAFTAGAAIRPGSVITGDASGPSRVPVLEVTPGFLDVLQVPLARGRFFRDGEEYYGKDEVVVLTDAFWRRRFNADPAVIGQTIPINEIPRQIIGILPAGFRYLSIQADMLIPLAHSEQDATPGNRHSNNLEYLARLRPGASLGVAQAQIDALNARLAAQDPYASLIAEMGFHTKVQNLHEEHVAQIRPTLLLLQAGVLFLLLIGIVNLVNLLLIRATARAKELALRQVLGSSRGRIAAEAIVETVLLALAGGLLGLGLGAAGLRTLDALGTDRMPLGSSIGFDGTVALAALAAAVAVGLLLAVPIIWYNFHGDLAPVLNTESRGGTTTRATHRLRHSLIVAQIALTFVLLASAGLLGLSFQRILDVAPGFESEHVMTAQVALPWTNYREGPDRFRFAERLLEELRTSPGIASAGLGTALPLSGSSGRNGIWVAGREPAPGAPLKTHYTYNVAGDYFQTLGVILHEGRYLNADDARNENRVCVVDIDFVQQYWPGESALGHVIYPGPPDGEGVKPLTIVGVLGSLKHRDLADPEKAGAVFVSYRADDGPFFNFIVVRTALAPSAATPALRQALARVDSRLPLDGLLTMDSRMSETLVVRRSPMILAWVFSAVALGLAALGIYGVLAYAVAQRRREIGVRMALGALPGQILRQFLGLGGRLLAVGVALGLAGATFVGRAMQALLYEISPLNLPVLGGTALLLAGVVLFASFMPSRRAAALSPLEALHAD